MIDYNPHSWFKLIFNTDSKNIFRQLWPPMVMLVLYTSGVVYGFNDYFSVHYPGATAIHSLLGVVLGLFLVFRTNTAYDRWWEGRKLWGKLVNDTRYLAIKISSILPAERVADRQFFMEMIGNIAFATKEHLRDSILISELSLPDETLRKKVIASSHRPNKLANALFERTHHLYKEQIIDGHQLYILDKELKGFVDMIGGCERIKTTPIPFSFSMFIKKFLFIYSMTLPVSFAWQFGYWTTPIVILTFYFLVSVELISEEIEDPFGEDINDLPLDEICFKIKNNVEEIMLEK